MGIDSLLQQNTQNTDSTGIGDTGRFDFMNKGMYPMSQMDRSYYATPTQVPLGAQSVSQDYDPATNPLTGEPTSRFAEGGIASFAVGGQSVFKDDPNNFAADLTKAYQATLGRDPSAEELRGNVDALNKDPDAYAFIVDQLADDPSAAKFHAENTKPQVDAEGNLIAAPEYDPNQIATELKGAYGKFTPTPEVGGIQGFANKIGPYAPFLAAAAAIAGPALAAELAAGEIAGSAAVPLAEITGSTFAGPAFALPEAAALTVGAPILDPALGITTIAPEAASSGFPGMSAELAAELGLGSSSGAFPASSSFPGMSPELATQIGLGGSGGITAKQAFAAKTLMDTAMKSANMGQDNQAGPSSTTTPLIFNPNANRATTPGIAPMGSNQPYGQLYDTKANTYNYFPQRYAQGGITNLARGGNASLGSYSDGGHLLKGPGDGMSDHIPATIGGKQPARLADGEFVIPADVVSHLGNGSTDAGAKQLYKMMDKIRKARTGRKSQGKQINPNKYTLKG
jgi:hypothetical protein